MVRFLIVDDSEIIRKQLRSFLEKKRNYIVDEANDGLEALQKLKADPDYDIIALDVEMPRLNGLETLRGIASMDIEGTPIMITSRSDFNTVIQAVRQGAYDYITKPIDFENLLIVIDRTLEKRALEKENKRLIDDLQKMNNNLSLLVRQRTKHLAEAEQKARKYANQLEKAYEELKTLDKMKGDFISLASHELRTPLVLIKGYSEILLRKRYGNIPEGVENALKIQADNIEKLSEIINDILIINNLEIMENIYREENVDVNSLILETCESVKEFVNLRNQTCGSDLYEKPLYVKGNKKLLFYAVHNVLINAIKYTPDGGHISVKTYHSNHDGIPRCIISISDTGIGIPENAFEKIFTPFYEVKDIKYHSSGKFQFLSSGLGVGLSIAKNIVRQHSGEISVESKLGEGSCFTIAIPLISKPPSTNEYS